MRKIVALFIAVAVVVAGWTGAWFYVRGQVTAGMDRAMVDMAAEGLDVSCPDRSASGWPFRIEVTCVSPAARLPDGRTLSAAALAATWSINDPDLVLVAAQSPLTVDGGQVHVETAFDRLRASLRLSEGTVPTVAVELVKPAATVTGSGPGAPTGVTAERAELHLRPTPSLDRALDMAVTLSGVMANDDGGPALPAPADAGVNVTVTEAALIDGTANGAVRWANAGGLVQLVEATLVIGDTRITGEGAANIDPDGQVRATIDSVATGTAWLTDAAREGKSLPPQLAALGSAFLMLGRPLDGDGAPRSLTISVDNGQISANGLALGQIPPVFESGS